MEAETPLLETVGNPFHLEWSSHDGTKPLEKHCRPPMDAAFPLPSWTRSKKDKTGWQRPQTIAHRGYKAKYPENTMGAFVGAVEAGADAIETDIHLSKDGVVVISHDATLRRCFGKDDKIIDCDWEYLSSQRTLKAPHEPMPRLKDLLEYLASPGRENIWVLLDIKLDNDADTVMRLIAQTINETPPNPNKPWSQRIVLGCWAAKLLPLCYDYLPHHPITHIGFTTTYARQFFHVPHISFNMLQRVLMGPIGSLFLRDAKARGRPVYAWTVNSEVMMRWCISQGLDGVITDDPDKYEKVCEEWRTGHREIKFPWWTWLDILWLHIMVTFIFGPMFRWKFREPVDRKLVIDRADPSP